MASLKKLLNEALEPVFQQLKQIHDEHATGCGETSAIKADLQLIKRFLGVEGGGATPEELQALGNRVQGLTAEVEGFDPNAEKQGE